MSFVNFIENLQRKPYSARFGIFFAAVIVSAVLVMVGFGFSVKYSLRDFAPADANADKEGKNNDSMLSLRDALKSSIGAIFDFKNDFNKNASDSDELKKGDSENTGLRLPDAD